VFNRSLKKELNLGMDGERTIPLFNLFLGEPTSEKLII